MINLYVCPIKDATPGLQDNLFSKPNACHFMLSNKNIVIIGGTTGIGFSAAKAFIQHGAKVVAVGRHADTSQQAQQELGDAGLVVTGDAIHENTAADAIELCAGTWGSFDGLYHVAEVVVKWAMDLYMNFRWKVGIKHWN